MSRRKQLAARHARILAAGLGISLVVHGVVLGLGSLKTWEIEGAGPLQVVNIVDAERIPEPPERAAEGGAAEAAAGGSWLAAEYVVVAVDVPAPNLSEHEAVLAAASSSALNRPLVPRPRIKAAALDSDFTPIHLTPTARLASNRGGKAKRSGGGGGGLSVTLGGAGVCGPGQTGVLGRGPGRRVGIR
ncbi:MAG: hypothetical protein PVJ64_12910 [Gemmatimonadales bacterium]|jgi:hypothetical protein